MKLKKVTALLLATSMVLSSVSVASFADEEIVDFGAEYQSEDNASDEVSFGDDVVVDEQNEEDSAAAEETFFSDEVIDETAGDTVVDDAIIEDSADDQEALAFEGDADVDEPIVDGNEDIYAAIASVDADYDTYVTRPIPETLTLTYNGENQVLDVSKIHGPVYYKDDEGDTDTWVTEQPELKEVGKYSWFVKGTDTQTGDPETKPESIFSITINIRPAKLTATLKSGKSFNWGDKDSAMTNDVLKLDDFTVTGVQKNDLLADLVEDKEAAGTFADLTTKGKLLSVVAPGTYKVDDILTTEAVKEATDWTLTEYGSKNYTLEIIGSNVTVKKLPVRLFWYETDEDKEVKTVTFDNSPHTLSARVATQGLTDDVDVDKEGYENATKKDVGEYVASAKIIGTVGEAVNVDITDYCEVTNLEWKWSIKKQLVRVGVNEASTVVYYGSADPLKDLTTDDLTFWVWNGEEWDDDAAPSPTDMKLSGKPTFTTTYEQFDPVTVRTGGDEDDPVYKNSYKILYKDGLTAANYDLETYDAKPGTVIVIPAPVVINANTVTVGVTEDPIDMTDKYTVSDWKDGQGVVVAPEAAESFKRDVEDGLIQVKLATVPNNPSAVKDYPVTVTITNKGSKPAVDNYNIYYTKAGASAPAFWSLTSAVGEDTADDRLEEKTLVDLKDSPLNNWTISDPEVTPYHVVWGDFKLELKDNEVKYDGMAHGLIMEPETKPDTIEIYYQTGSSKPEGYENSLDEADTFIKAASQNMPTRTDVGETKVWYLITSKDYKTTKDPDDALCIWGTSSIKILSVPVADAKEVEKKIDEATKRDAEGKLDPEKVKEARAAYDALSDAAKKEVSTAKRRKLEDAEKEIAGDTDAKAAKTVEDEIDKLPAADKATAADKEAADKAKADYDALTDAQKALVPAEKVKKMNDVKAAADEAAKIDDAKKAKAVEDEIDALPEAGNATAADKAAADKAAADLEALTDAQKALVPAEKKEKLAMVQAAIEKAVEEDEKAEKERELFDEAVALVKAQKSGVDGKNAADNAKKAYDNLSDAAKAKLTDEEIDAYEDTQKAYARNYTFNSGEGVFKVLGNGEVTYFKPLHPENTWFVVPNMVKKNGFVYKVIKVSTKAFMGCVNATKIKIGKNVQVMGEYVFKNTPAMGKLIFLTSKLASGKVKNSFVAGGKNGGAKLTNYVPSGKSSAYDSLFKGEGGMNAGAKFTESN